MGQRRDNRAAIRPGAERKPGLRNAGGLVERLSRPVVRARGFVHAEILTRWAAIVGASLSAQTLPVKFIPGRQGGVLQVRVDGPVAVELQHREVQIIERLNTYFGYRAVARLRLIQGPVHHNAAPPRPEDRRGPLAPGADDHLQAVDDAGLRAALRRLGEGIAGRRSSCH